MEKYDVFISYRREGGGLMAGRIADRLRYDGYSVFFDVEEMHQGEFNKQIFDAIDNCIDFVIILSPKALDRCVEPNDWVRQELAYALKQKKNVVPILMTGFEFPNNLPEDINDIRFKEGVEESSVYFNAVVAKLKEYLDTKLLVKQEYVSEKGKIKLPFFLKAPNSSFMQNGSSVISLIVSGHKKWEEDKQLAESLSLQEYLEKNEKRNLNYEKNYRAYYDFKAVLTEDLKTVYRLEIESLIDVMYKALDALKQIVGELYETKPLFYDVRIAELLWIFFEIDGRWGMFDMGGRESLQHIFQISNISECFEIFARSEYNIFSEMSATVDLLIAGTNCEKDDLSFELYRFFAIVVGLFSFATSNSKTYKKMKKYLQINYKYMKEKMGEIPVKVYDLISDIIDGINKSI